MLKRKVSAGIIRLVHRLFGVQLKVHLFFLVFVLLLFTGNAHAQNPVQTDTLHPRLYTDDSMDRNISVAFDPVRDDFYILDNEANLLCRINKYEQPDTLSLPFPDDIEFLMMEVRKDGQGLYFWDGGGGRVFFYDIESDSLRRVDNSFKQRAFYYHAPMLTDDHNIWLMGGYGFFNMKNNLIYFNEDLQEWLEKESTGEIPPESMRGYLIQVPEENDVLYLEWIENIEEELDPEIHVYRYDLDTSVWEKGSEFEVPSRFLEDLQNNRTSFLSTGTYKYDQENGLLMLENIMAYDIRNNEMLFLDRSRYQEEVFSGVHFYDEDRKAWYFLSRQPTNQPFLDAYSWTFDELPEETLVRVKPRIWSPDLMILSLGGVFLLIAAISIGFIFRKKDDTHTDTPPISLMVEGDKIDLRVKGKRIHVTDPSEKEMWKMIHELLEKDQQAISMADADQRLFGDHVPLSQRSRNRKKLVETVQQKTGCDFLTIKRDDIDKRFKVLTINGRCFNLGDKD